MDKLRISLKSARRQLTIRVNAVFDAVFENDAAKN